MSGLRTRSKGLKEHSRAWREADRTNDRLSRKAAADPTQSDPWSLDEWKKRQAAKK